MSSENQYIFDVDLSYKATNAAVTKNKSSSNAKSSQKGSAKVNSYSAISFWINLPCMEKLISLNLAYTVQSNDLLNTKNFYETNSNYMIGKCKAKKQTFLSFNTSNRKEYGNFSANIESNEQVGLLFSSTLHSRRKFRVEKGNCSRNWTMFIKT